jgi:hypothetical protein
MGLSVQVGVLADLLENDPEGAEWLRDGFAAANKILSEHRLPPHSEPTSLPPLNDRCSLISYPYSFLHHLRRAYAHRKANAAWIAEPLPQNVKPTDDPVLQAEYRRQISHLLTHSDAEGFYLPIDFKEVVFDRGEGVPGEMIGSSYRLRDELLIVAPALQIELDGAKLPDHAAEEINSVLDAQTGLFIEKTVWLSLFEAARMSIEHKTAIVFG